MIATTIEQSKKLLELGLPEDGADMYYIGDTDREGILTVLHGYNTYEEIVNNFPSFYNKVLIPAWSLEALLRLMPKIKKIGYISNYPKLLRNYATDEWYMDCLRYTTGTFDSPLDAAYDMVVWLLENKII